MVCMFQSAQAAHIPHQLVNRVHVKIKFKKTILKPHSCDIEAPPGESFGESKNLSRSFS